MNKKQSILKYLKTKAKALGFSKKELESVAADIADNLELEEEASDEDVNAAIEKAVDAVIPYLKVSQAAANRVIQAYKDAHPVEKDDDDEGEEDDEPTQTQASKKPKKKGKKAQTTTDDDDDTPGWAKRLFERIDKIEGANTADKRRSQLEELLKDTGSFGKRTLKAFGRMEFKDDEEFEDFLEEVKSDLEELNQERANEGLSKLGSVPSTGKKTDEKKDEVELMSEDELKELADGF